MRWLGITYKETRATRKKTGQVGARTKIERGVTIEESRRVEG